MQTKATATIKYVAVQGLGPEKEYVLHEYLEQKQHIESAIIAADEVGFVKSHVLTNFLYITVSTVMLMKMIYWC